MTAFRKELLQEAVDMYDDVVRRNPGEQTLGLGVALNNQTLVQYLLGEMTQAADSAQRAEATLSALQPTYEARRALADARKQLGVVDFAAGRLAEGLEKTEQSVALYQALIVERPDDQDTRFQLVLATVNLGNFAMQRDPDGAIARYREALGIVEGLRKQSPANPYYSEWQARTTSNLGLILTQTGKIEAAIAAQREAVAAAEQITDEFLKLDALATCRNNLAEALGSANNTAKAEPIFRQALGDYRTLAGRFPNEIDYQWSVAMVLTNIAALTNQRGSARKHSTSLMRPRRPSSTSPPRWERMKSSRCTDRRTSGCAS